MTAESPPAQPRPQTLREIFWAFTWLALQGFGGVLAVVQREMVDKKQWLTREQFIEDWAVAQVLPGPSVVNLSMMIGDHYFGVRGGLVALAGMLAFPLVIVLALAALFAGVSDMPQVQGAVVAGQPQLAVPVAVQQVRAVAHGDDLGRRVGSHVVLEVHRRRVHGGEVPAHA